MTEGRVAARQVHKPTGSGFHLQEPHENDLGRVENVSAIDKVRPQTQSTPESIAWLGGKWGAGGMLNGRNPSEVFAMMKPMLTSMFDRLRW